MHHAYRMTMQESALNLLPLPLAVFVVDASGVIASWNKACEKLAGYTAADIRSQRLEQIIEFDDARESAAVHRRPAPSSTRAATCAAPTGAACRCASRSRRNRSTRTRPAPTASSSSPRRPAPSRYALIQDLPTADLIEGLPCVFYVIDQSGHLLLWNHQLEECWKCRAKSCRPSNVEYFFDEKDRAEIVQKILDAFEKGSSSHEAEVVGKHGKRTTLPVPLRPHHLGDLPCIFGTGLDITARKQTEQGLRIRERAIYSSVNAIVITCCEDGETPDRVRQPGVRADHRLHAGRGQGARPALHAHRRLRRDRAQAHPRRAGQQGKRPVDPAQRAQERRDVLERPAHRPGHQCRWRSHPFRRA